MEECAKWASRACLDVGFKALSYFKRILLKLIFATYAKDYSLSLVR
jgi:hypothetical protein